MNPKKPTQTNAWSFQSNELGKIPPQDVELEKAILGACMIEREAFPLVITFLGANDFYKESHQRIYEAFVNIYSQNEPIDLLVVTVQLRKMGMLDLCGGALYITELTTKVSSAANIETHALFLKQLSNRRELIRIAHDTLSKAYDETSDSLKLIDEVSDRVYKLNTNIAPTISFSHQVSLTLASIEARKSGAVTGIPSKMTEVNRFIGGYEKQYYIKAARPAMGKSINMVNEAVHMATMGYKVLIFSLEMSFVMQCSRMISLMSGVDSNKFKRGSIDHWELAQVKSNAYKLAGLPITVYDMSYLTPNQMKAIAQKHKTKEGLDVVFLDYLQLVDGEDANETVAINKVSDMCRRMPKDLDLTLIAYAQLSRAVESRGGDKRPTLADIRQSGKIEQDAFCVSFFWRPEYYGIKSFDDGMSTQNLMFEIFAKNRDDITGDAIYHFDGAKNLCCDIANSNAF